MNQKRTANYQTPAVEIILHGEDIISTSAIELPFIPMGLRGDGEESEI